jgi:hypothetical protein
MNKNSKIYIAGHQGLDRKPNNSTFKIQNTHLKNRIRKWN